MTSNSYSHQPRGYFTQSARAMVPLAPAPSLPPSYLAPHLNVPVAPVSETTPSPPQEEDLTSDLHFPVRLHYMLTDIHKEGIYTNIVSWQPHGRCFVVHDKKQFVDKILCLWFRQSKWPSFQRQLNMYGFKRLSHGLDKGGYYHDMFLQDYPLLAKKIQRQKVKGNGPRRPAQPDQEPNFYAMPSLRSDGVVAQPFQAYVVNGCYAKPSPGPITLRSSLVMTANQVGLRNIPARVTAVTTAAPVRSTEPTDPPATEPVNISPVSGPRYDEEDMDALTQLASWF